MAGVQSLKTSDHFLQRDQERSLPRELLETFGDGGWDLVLAEVRNDSGKFVASTWRRSFEGKWWWIAIGYHNTVLTAYQAPASKDALGADILRSGELYDFVERVNANLLRESPKSQPPP